MSQTPPSPPSTRMLHAISVDVEDWFQSTIDARAALSDRFERSTAKVLEAFAAAGVRGTFFVLGLAAEKAPHVVRQIAEAGHEIQSHGYAHRLNYDLAPAEFREDVVRARKLLEDLAGREVFGYRAPCFTIDERNLWVLDILAETGHRYDSSIFPQKTSRYGIDGYPPEPRIVTTPLGRRLVEAPVACFDWLGKRRPVGGGGYFRLWPYWVIRKAWRQLEAVGRPGVVYFHPYEYDVLEMSAYRVRVGLAQRIHQGLGRRGFPGKIDRLLRDFRFGPMEEVLAPLLRELA
jgi:polysaccharide deacetylase family protein (PEP-CTERM system associated)